MLLQMIKARCVDIKKSASYNPTILSKPNQKAKQDMMMMMMITNNVSLLKQMHIGSSSFDHLRYPQRREGYDRKVLGQPIYATKAEATRPKKRNAD